MAARTENVERQGLWLLLFVGVSMVAHVVVALVAWLAPGVFDLLKSSWVALVALLGIQCTAFDDPPPPEVLEVAIIAKSDMPRKAMRAPDPVRSQASEAPTEPTPVETSRESSDLEVVREKPTKPKAKVDKPDQVKPSTGSESPPSDGDLASLLDEALMEAALESTDARSQLESSPDGVEIATLTVGSSGTSADPWWGAVKKKFDDAFSPVRSVIGDDPTLRAQIRVRFDPATGKITGWEWVKKSGNPSFDGAAERAVQQVRDLPPIPDRLAGKLGGSYIVEFTPDS